uniref:Uncharacterized protein n=1 Tax=Romanomermis culicivorax TaxID=13658 RepID=A0A915HYQ6_ROMCU
MEKYDVNHVTLGEIRRHCLIMSTNNSSLIALSLTTLAASKPASVEIIVITYPKSLASRAILLGSLLVAKLPWEVDMQIGKVDDQRGRHLHRDGTPQKEENDMTEAETNQASQKVINRSQRIVPDKLRWVKSIVEVQTVGRAKFDPTDRFNLG